MRRSIIGDIAGDLASTWGDGLQRSVNEGHSVIPQHAIGRFQRRTFFILMMSRAVGGLSVAGFLWGTTVLAMRMAGIASWRVPLYLAAGAVVAVWVGCAIWAVRRVPRAAAVRALLDDRGRCGGLLAAGEVMELGEWAEQLPKDEPRVRLRWHAGRTMMIFVIAMAFAATGFVVPARVAQETAAQTAVRTQSERLEDQIELLKEEKLVPPEQADEWKDELSAIDRSVEKSDGPQTWEAMDHLSQTLEQAAEKSAESAVNATEQLAMLEAMASALSAEASGDEGSAMSAEAMQALAELAAKAMKSGLLSDQQLMELAKKALDGKTLSPKDLAKLAELAEKNKEAIAAMVSKLCKKGLCKPGAMKACKGAGQCDGEALAAFLEKCGSCNGSKACSKPAGACGGGAKPCSGGVNRGRGDAEMTWTDGSKEDGAKFKEQVLDSAEPEDKDGSTVLMVTKAAPKAETTAAEIRRGGLKVGAAGHADAAGQAVLPRHRAAVRQYFDASTTAK